jgi:hypothetical protein
MGDHLADADLRVPPVEQPQVRVGGRPLAVGAHGGRDDVPPTGWWETALAGHDREAGGEPFDVPFPRPGQCLVKVVEVDDDVAFRGGELAEIGDVRVPRSAPPVRSTVLTPSPSPSPPPLAAGTHSAWDDLGTCARRARPASRRSSRLAPEAAPPAAAFTSHHRRHPWSTPPDCRPVAGSVSVPIRHGQFDRACLPAKRSASHDATSGAAMCPASRWAAPGRTW